MESENLETVFCPLPWMHLATNPTGFVTLCCESNSTLYMNAARDYDKNGHDDPETLFSRLKKTGINTLDEIINSDYFKDVRLQMLNGKKPEACQKCYSLENMMLPSKRSYEQNNYPHFNKNFAQSLTEHDGAIEPDLEYVELRSGNICNLKCRSCNPASSSKWWDDWKHLKKMFSWVEDYNSVKTMHDRALKPDFWSDLLAHSKNIREIYINGGEPFLIQNNWKYLQDLINTGRSKKSRLWYSTNMTCLPDIAFDLWKEFKSVNISASIDDLMERNYYLRHPTEWDKVLSTIEKLDKNNIHWQISQTIGPINLFYLYYMFEWSESVSCSHLVYNFINDPPYLAPHILPHKMKSYIIENKLSCLPHRYKTMVVKYLRMVENFDITLWEQFQDHTVALDEIRDESFSKTFPEFVWTLNKLKIIHRFN